MVSLLHAVAGLRDAPEREESDDADHEVEQVKHGISPCVRMCRRTARNARPLRASDATVPTRSSMLVAAQVHTDAYVETLRSKARDERIGFD